MLLRMAFPQYPRTLYELKHRAWSCNAATSTCWENPYFTYFPCRCQRHRLLLCILSLRRVVKKFKLSWSCIKPCFSPRGCKPLKAEAGLEGALLPWRGYETCTTSGSLRPKAFHHYCILYQNHRITEYFNNKLDLILSPPICFCSSPHLFQGGQLNKSGN